MLKDTPPIEFIEGKAFRAMVPFWGYNNRKGGKIYIVKVINEGFGEQIVYRAFGRHKRWWHYFIESKLMLEFYIHQIAIYEKDRA